MTTRTVVKIPKKPVAVSIRKIWSGGNKMIKGITSVGP